MDEVTSMKRCPKCDQWLAREAFSPDKRRPDGLACHCRACKHAYHVAYKARKGDAHRKSSNAAKRKYLQSNPEARKSVNRKRYLRKVKERDTVLDQYGAVCVCCRERERRFLTVDHVDGGGNAHRKAVSNVYAAVIREGFPVDRYQILCINCNWGRAFNNGICPHVSARAVAEADTSKSDGIAPVRLSVWIFDTDVINPVRSTIVYVPCSAAISQLWCSE